MKCGARVALGVAGGYLLGRTKKMKFALMLGGLAAGRKAGGPGQLLAQTTKLLGQSADLTRLSDEVRGRLLEAGKAAAVAVATRQVEALTERVVTRVGTLSDAGGRTVSDVGGTVGDVGRTAGDVGRAVRGRRRPDEVEESDETNGGVDEADVDEVDVDEADVDEADLDEADVDEADVDEADVDEADVDEADEDAAAAGEDEEEEPPPPPRRTSRAAAGGRRSARTGLTSAAGDATTAGRATGRRSGRPARGPRESSDG